ncbi:MAG: multifunctional oxoglutarate decarboxylase/oxoglutarate dehydrogenase thiamine pyrophosphate-binding subunit/dihydrolipoyllysine-residue succinyltransferase subunit [Vulcanimicrobiaceae bacterium]
MPETIVKVTLPEMGESVTEGSIVEWRVKPGQWIEEGQTLVDVTTDKVDVEVPAPASGVVTALSAEEGATVAVGATLAEIDTSAAKPEGDAAAAAPAPAVPAVAVSAAAAPNGSANAAVASHRAQRLAEREHLDLKTVRGTGPAGMILLEDVRKASAAWPEHGLRNGAAAPPSSALAIPAAVPLLALPPQAKVSPLKGPAASLVGYMEQSLTIPTATSFRTLQVGTLESSRAELNASLQSSGRAEKVSFTHLIAFALVRAAREQRAIVATFRRENGTLNKVESGVHLGIAVDSQRKDGTRFLVVPVIKDADQLDFVRFRAKYEELIAKARDSKLTADELSGATFSLTNPGGIGTVASVPRLMPGQGAIIAAGAITYPPGFQRANEAILKQLGVEKVMTLTSTYDHRVIQGAQSGEFLKRTDELLRGSERFYEEVFASFGISPPRSQAVLATSGAPGRDIFMQTVSPVAVMDQAPTLPREIEAYSDELLRAVAAGAAILSAYRRHGHLAAMLDPLGTQPEGDPALDWHNYGLTPSIMSAIPAAVLRTKLRGDTLADIVGELHKTYSSTIAYEVEHIANIEQREWLRDYIESGNHVIRLLPERARNVLARLTKVETFERYLRKSYLGQKTFSIEGLDAMIPMLEELITEIADDGVETAVLGMAHRGRLSAIAHVVNRQYEELLAEFDAADLRKAGIEDEDVTGDVKYHHGATGTYVTLDGKEVAVVLANNPSHLEAVDAVVEGRTRALQTKHETPIATLEPGVAAPILIHGDAAFSAQGIIAEVLNLQALAGYATGGTVHIIANNQVGFTTDPKEGRSTRYASDLAKGFDVPIVHVNADDVDACIAAVHLAVDFRRRFGHDVIIDLIGYRRFGHNETDEPAYTQPDMYERIKTHPTVRELYAQKLIAQGVVTAEDVNALIAQATARITDAHRHVKRGEWEGRIGPQLSEDPELERFDGPVPKEQLLAWSDELVRTPPGFTPHPKLLRQLEKRRQTFIAEGEVDWGLAESLAFASLLSEGSPIRMTGQDVERGTFSHRHLVLHDAKTNEKFAPIQHLSDSRASFEIHNSPLSEYACLGFEYGYSVELPDALVVWEAQFGDFMNGAQIIIDQFIAAGYAKWGETSRLVLLLPHGYEGAGPEHSSARIERFLQLSAEGNVHVANCSTAAQYFHLLRLQARQPRAVPLVIFTPKSLLRLRGAAGRMDELSNGMFKPVIDDERFAANPEAVQRVLLCSGKIYHDLVSHPDYTKMTHTAIVRVELLSPLPTGEILWILASYSNLEEIVWVQEEPKNMGARAHVRRRLVERLPHGIKDVGYIGRSYRASPSEGYGGAHEVEQERIVREALREDAPVPSADAPES